MSKDVFLGPSGQSIKRDGSVQLAEGRQATLHRLRIRLLWALGEWDLEPDVGIPYREAMNSKPPGFDILRGAIQTQLLDDEVVTSIEEINFDMDQASRTLNVQASVVIDRDEELVVRGSLDF